MPLKVVDLLAIALLTCAFRLPTHSSSGTGPRPSIACELLHGKRGKAVLGNESGGRRRRLGRLYRHDPERLLVVPLDHALGAGPLGVDLDDLVGRLAAGGADAVVLHKGALR